MSHDHDPVEDLTMGQIAQAHSVWTQIVESLMGHALVVLADPDHKCEPLGFGPDDDLEQGSGLDAESSMAYFAFEASALEMFSMVRQAMRYDGDPVQLLADYVASEFADTSG